MDKFGHLQAQGDLWNTEQVKWILGFLNLSHIVNDKD